MSTDTEALTTEAVLAGMLTENTGASFLDSGSAYGRNWERNQGRDVAFYEAEPPATLDVSRWRSQGQGGEWHFELGITLSVFHFLKDRLEYHPELDARFTRYAEREENKDEGWISLMESFPATLTEPETAEEAADEDYEPFASEVGGIYGDGKPFTENTYNGEDALSQVIQYTYFTVDSQDAYVILQIHGGCDVRGGYTRPRVFSAYGLDNSTDMFDNAHGTVACEPMAPERTEVPGQMTLDGTPAPEPERPESHYWDTDNGGYSWYAEGACGAGAGKELQEYDFTADEAERGKGKVYISEDKRAFCPLCGGELKAYPPCAN